MGRKTEKVKFERVHSHTPSIRIERRGVQKRKATNFEILRDAIDSTGNVKLRIALGIFSPTYRNYVAFCGASMILVAPDMETAEAFPELLRQAVAKIASENGMKATRKDAPL